MRRSEKVTRTEERLVEVSCDLCRSPMSFRDGAKSDRVTIERRETDTLDFSGDSVTASFDVCVGCWNEIVVPFMMSNGAKPAVTRCSW